MTDEEVLAASVASVAPAVHLAAAPVTRKLDLASGQNPREGYEGVDIWPGAQHVVDLQCYPWPFADGSVAELRCSHYIEHIPMGVIGLSGLVVSHMRDNPEAGDPGHLGKDALFAFFDECYRILAPGGVLELHWPAHSNDRAFQDPTHRRFIPLQTMNYLNEEWRRANLLDHYRVDCNFEVIAADPTITEDFNLRTPAVITSLINHERNRAVDYTAKLRKLPRLPAAT